jgi:signal transduction histidine kinase
VLLNDLARLADMDHAAPLPRSLALATLARRALVDVPLGALLHEAAPLVARELAAPLVAIWQVLPGDGALCLVAGVGVPEALLGQALIAPDDRTPERAALALGSPLVVADQRAERRFAPPAWLPGAAFGGVAVAAIPGDGHPVGVIAAYDRAPRAFDAAAVACLREVATILGLAHRRRAAADTLRQTTGDLERLLRPASALPVPGVEPANVPHLDTAHPPAPDYVTEEALRAELRSSRQRGFDLMERRLADRTRQLTAIYAITATASAPLAPEALLSQSLDLILDVAGAAAGAILIAGDPREPARHIASRGLLAVGLSRPLADVPAGAWLLEHDRPLLVRDTSVDPRTVSVPWLPRGHACALVPIHARGEVRGALAVVRAWGRPFAADEAALLAAVADQVGVAVENARLFAEVQQRANDELRQALSRDLHDSLTQSLYSLTLLAEVTMRQLREGDPALIEDYLQQLGATARQAMREMRLLIYELRAGALDDESLADALERRLDAVERRAGLTAHLVVEGAADLPVAARTELFLIAQEALNNVLKHAQASRVRVEVREAAGHLELVIADNGLGFDPERLLDRGGLGLLSMRERAAGLGGTANIGPNDEGGVRVAVRVPLAGVPHPAVAALAVAR